MLRRAAAAVAHSRKHARTSSASQQNAEAAEVQGRGNAGFSADAELSAAQRTIRLHPPTHDSIDANLQQRLAGRYIAECGGNGNCLFHVLSFLAYGRPDKHKELRTMAANFFADQSNAQHPVVRKLADELALVHDAGDGMLQPAQTVATYSFDIRTNGQMGSLSYELPVLAELLGLRVSVVIMSQARRDTTLGAELLDHCVQAHHREGQSALHHVSLLYVNRVSTSHNVAHRTAAAGESRSPDCKLTSLSMRC